MRIVSSGLIEIAEQINAENAALACDLKNSLQRAARIGALLLKAKAMLPHGKFMNWAAENVTVGREQARKYMALAANSQSTGILSGRGVEAAYVAIQAERKPAKRTATGPKTKASKARLEALNEVGQHTYTASRLRACIRALKEFPEEADGEMALIEELHAVLAGFIKRANARPMKAA